MNKHTPGPWESVGRETYVAIFARGYERSIATADSYAAGFGPGQPERDANAVLMASSPTMLEALYEARTQVEILQSRLGIEDHGSGTLSIINAAIREATGNAD